MDQRTRKLMIIHTTLYLRDDVNKLYASRKGRGIEFACIEGSVDATIRGLEDYIKKRD